MLCLLCECLQRGFPLDPNSGDSSSRNKHMVCILWRPSLGRHLNVWVPLHLGPWQIWATGSGPAHRTTRTVLGVCRLCGSRRSSRGRHQCKRARSGWLYTPSAEGRLCSLRRFVYGRGFVPRGLVHVGHQRQRPAGTRRHIQSGNAFTGGARVL